MPLIPGVALSMNSSGVVSGTASSMALVRGQANALRCVQPAFDALDDAMADPDNPLDPAAAATQKQAIVDAWNDTQAPLILADSQAICSHVLAHLRITLTSAHGGMQRIPDPATPFAWCEAPNPDFVLEGVFT